MIAVTDGRAAKGSRPRYLRRKVRRQVLLQSYRRSAANPAEPIRPAIIQTVQEL